MRSNEDADRRARFTALVEANHAALLGYALRRTDRVEDAHDVVSETFLVAWRRLDDVPDGDRTRPWLYGTARRVLANHHRGGRRRRRLQDRLTGELAARGSDDHAPPEDTSERVAAAFARLRDDDRELLLLVGWEGLAPSDAAAVLGCAPVTARVRLHRARQRFARELAAEGLQRDGSAGHVDGAASRPPVDDRTRHDAST